MSTSKVNRVQVDFAISTNCTKVMFVQLELATILIGPDRHTMIGRQGFRNNNRKSSVKKLYNLKRLSRKKRLQKLIKMPKVAREAKVLKRRNRFRHRSLYLSLLVLELQSLFNHREIQHHLK